MCIRDRIKGIHSNTGTLCYLLVDLCYTFCEQGLAPVSYTHLANGVGKSTLLRTLSAFQPAVGGEIEIMGKKLTDLSLIHI